MSADTTPGLEAERAQFESWWLKSQGEKAQMWDRIYGERTPETMKGKYILAEERAAWAAWQAARRIPAPAPQGPTDAEIDLLVRAYLGECGPQASRIYSFVRAALASWGAPAASSSKP